MSREPIDTPETPGGLPPEPVEDRPNVGTVKPSDYPDRKQPGPDDDKEEERRNPASGSNTPSGPDSGTERDLA